MEKGKRTARISKELKPIIDYPLNMSNKPKVQGYFDPTSNTVSYIVTDPEKRACAIIDSVLDLDCAAGYIVTESADRLIEAVTAQGLTVE